MHCCTHTRAGEVELTLTLTLTLTLNLTLTSMRTRVGEVERDGEHAARQPIGPEHDLEQIAARSGTRARSGGWVGGWAEGRGVRLGRWARGGRCTGSRAGLCSILHT